MLSLPKPDVICTHESDLDGLVSGMLLKLLAKSRFGDDVRLEAYHYQGWQRRSLGEKSAWVSDFSFESRMDRTDWIIIDHHVSDVQPRMARMIHDTTKSAALLCYELCRADGITSPKLDRLVHLTNVGDLFLTDDPDFWLACDYASLVKTYGFWPLYELCNGHAESILDHPLLEVMSVKRRVEDPLGYDWARRHVQELSPQVGVVDTVVGNTNLIVHRLLQEGGVAYPVLATLFKKSSGAIVVSFRSRNGEALKVASKLQGGGHPNAAGTTLPQGVRDLEAAVAHLRQTLNPRIPKGTGLNSMEDSLNALKF